MSFTSNYGVALNLANSKEEASGKMVVRIKVPEKFDDQIMIMKISDSNLLEKNNMMKKAAGLEGKLKILKLFLF